MKKALQDRKSFIFTTIIAVLLLIGALFLFTVRNSRRITAENREYLNNNAMQSAENIDAALAEGYDNIKILSSLVSSSLTGPEFDIASIQGLIKNSVFDFMEFADKEGMDHNITGGVSDAHDRQYYRDAKDGNTGMELIYVSRATHETLLMFYSPIYYEKEFVGSLVGVYQASNRITKLLSSEYFGEKATSYLATGIGRIIACSDGFDPQNEMYLRNLAQGDGQIEKTISKAVATGSTANFSPKGNRTGGCLVRLPESGMYLVQIFPEQAGERMISSANRLGYQLVAFLIILYIAIMLSLVNFYRSQQKLVEKAKSQAEQANQAKTSFLFNMSHDIRTPMNAILGFTDMSLKYIDDKDRVRDYLNKTRQSGNLLLKLINSVLDMSRIESGSAQSEEEDGDIYESLASIETTMRETGAAKNVDVSFEFGEITDRWVCADFNRCARVFTNLINNAVKYTREGGYVHVRCDQEGPEKDGTAFYRYTIKDNGIGMSEEFQNRMFDAFSREHSTTASGIQGTGLGLSVCRSFVEYLGGKIDCESLQGVGTIFTVKLPFKVIGDPERIAKITAGQGKEEGTAADNNRLFSLRGRKVLLVEDNELNREIARDVLEEEGLEVDEAENGVAAVDLLKENGPEFYDFILMDIQMPVMDGYEATGRIRKLYPDMNIPIIAVSANAFSEDREASLRAGMNDHIAKPVNADELLMLLAGFVKE